MDVTATQHGILPDIAGGSSSKGDVMAVPMQVREVVSRQLLADHVYDRLMVELVDGRLEAGAPISIDALAREFGVSQTPVREALARIEWTGLVTRIALKGYRVAPPFNADDLRQLFEARRVIEPANASAAAVRLTPELCDGLQQDLEDLETAPRGPSFADFRRYWEADERFHRRIAEHSGNRYLLRSYSALGGQVQRYRLFVGRGVTDAQPTLHEHGLILAAIRAGDPDLARSSMDRHIAAVWERALQESASAK